MVCTVCSHERVKEINKALLSGQTGKATARKFGLVYDTLRSHWHNCLPWRDRHAKPVTTDEKLQDLGLEMRRLQVVAECGENVLGLCKWFVSGNRCWNWKCGRKDGWMRHTES